MENRADNLEEGFRAYDDADYEKALEILLPLAAENITQAQCAIASMYHLGLGTAFDGHEAIKWYLKAGSGGSALAYHNLGTLYRAGMPDVPCDPDKAREYYRKSIDLGSDMISASWLS